MVLVLLIAAILVLALGLVQAWTIWFLKREVQRLEFRLGESLDDEDLLEFQERLKTLIAEAKKTSTALAKTADARRLELEQSLERAKQAEKNLALRIVAKSAAEAPSGANAAPKPAAKAAKKTKAPEKTKAPASAQETEAPQASRTPKAGPKRGELPAPQAKVPRAPEPESAGDAVSDGKISEDRRSYLVRPQPSALPNKHQKVYELADQGLDLEQIAKRSGLLAGEVDLILNLRRKGPLS